MILFLLPVYNEEKNIHTLLHNIASTAAAKEWDYHVCIVDDGSTDATVDMVTSLQNQIPITLLANPCNMGPGAAFNTGFLHISENYRADDTVVTMEADNTSDLSILETMLAKIRSGTDLVLASCYSAEGGVEGTNLYRRILSWGANLLMHFIFAGQQIRTFSSFYRCYRLAIIQEAYRKYGDNFIAEHGFVCAVDILLKLNRLDIKIEEVPMVLRCQLRNGRSKMKTVKTIFAYLKLFARELLGTR